MRRLVLAAITAYQRHLSPHKGFVCAYRVHTGRMSCSVLGYRAVRRYGVVRGLALLRRRTDLCGDAHRRYMQTRTAFLRSQQGFCDAGCDLPCDLPGLDGCASAGDVANFCNCGGCDGSNRNPKRKDDEQHVHIPTNVGRRLG